MLNNVFKRIVKISWKYETCYIIASGQVMRGQLVSRGHFSTDLYILDHAKLVETMRHFFGQCK